MIGLINITLVRQKQVWDKSFQEATVRLEFHERAMRMILEQLKRNSDFNENTSSM